ncbi:MAG: hypothetical protein V1487_02525, partial [bacterium]
IPAFPYYSQKDPAWKDVEYDKASEWAPGREGIGRWGCAITSVAMILNNYGVKDPSGVEATPDKLNTWLLDQTDGYVREGHLNWLAIARYVKESYDAGQSTTKLEFSRTRELPLTLPAIVGEPGHFVVAHASSSAALTINDPNDSTRVTKLKTDPIVSSNIYQPSLTDLSYFLLVADSGTTLTLTNEGGSDIPLEWMSEYLNDDEGGLPRETIQTAMVSKPASGKYRLQSSGTGKIELYLYDENGEVKMHELSSGESTTIYEIEYGRTNAEGSRVTELDTTQPMFVSTTLFLGWYSASPSAEFVYADPYLRPDYVNPSCMITSEGMGVTCSISPSVCDTSGNCNTDPQTSSGADVDWTPPTSNFSLPSLSNSWDGKIEGTASDNVSGVAQVELLIKNPAGIESTALVDGTNNWSYTLSTLTEGKYVIKSRATDGAGNVESELKVHSIIRDTIPPETPKIIYANDWWQNVWVYWKSVKGANRYRVYYGTKVDQLTNVTEIKHNQWLSGHLPKGKYYCGVTALDKAGNESRMSKIVKVEVKKIWKWR